MHYMLMLNGSKAELDKRNDLAQTAAYWGGWNAFIGAMSQAGIVVKGDEAEHLLTNASQAAYFGRFQCEAAIQSVHAQRAITGVPEHGALRTLYDLLLAHAPSVGVAVGRAAFLLTNAPFGLTEDTAVRAFLAELGAGDLATS